VLYPHRDELHERKSVFGIIDTVQGLRWMFLSNLRGYIPLLLRSAGRRFYKSVLPGSHK
jgi:hypothetical protein